MSKARSSSVSRWNGRPVLNGLAAKGQRRRRDPYSATLFARDIVQSLRRQIGFRRQGEPVDDAAVDEFLATVIWDIPVEDSACSSGSMRRGGMP